MKSSVLFLFFGLTSFTASALATTVSYLDQIEALVASSPASVDEFLERLPREFKTQYLLIYSSRSLQSASPANPRVVLQSPDRQFYLAFSDGQGTKPGDRNVELIESRALRNPQFATVTWIGNTPQLIRNPTNCAVCHQGAPIFDEYPNWPGFYGSTDNGQYYGQRLGSGMMTRMDLELDGLRAFQRSAPTRPLYRHLIGLDTLTYQDLLFANTRTDLMIKNQLEERQNQQIYQTLNGLEELETAVIASYPYTLENSRDVHNAPKEPFIPAFLSEARFAEFRAYRAANAQRYDDERDEMARDRFRRIEALVRQYGSPLDRSLMPETGFAPYVDKWSPFTGPYPQPRTDLGIPTPQMMNYFGREGVLRSSSLFYSYWLSRHPEVPRDVPITAELQKGGSRSSGGNSVGLVLTPYIGISRVPDSHRTFEDLYEWVPLPLKQYAWDDVQAKPLVASRFNRIQKAFLGIIAASPVLATSKPRVFLEMRSWSPENLAELRRLIGP